MTTNTVENRLIVKGNIYFLGWECAKSNGCNFDPLHPDQLLPSWRGSLPESANVITDGMVSGLGASSSWLAVAEFPYDSVTPTTLNEVYCTGKIYSILPIRYNYTGTNDLDRRTPTQGTISDGIISGVTRREAQYPA